MSQRRICFLAALLLAGLGLSLGARSEEPGPDQDSPPSIQALLDRIDQLEKRIERLERRQPRIAAPRLVPRVPPEPPEDAPEDAPDGDQMPRLPPQVIPPQLIPKLPGLPGLPRVVPHQRPTLPPMESVPEDWERREFNGQPFYVVPLGTP